MTNPTDKYVILGSEGYYAVAWRDVMHLDGVAYYPSMLVGCKNWAESMLTRFCFSLRYGCFCPSIIRKKVYQQLLPIPFDSNETFTIVFFECWYAVYTTSYVSYLRAQYPHARLVLYLQDIVYSNPLFDIETLKNVFDLICTYDQGDAARYNLPYFPTPYSRLPQLSTSTNKYDLFFCGNAKNRLEDILTIYHQATQNGQTCLFYINGVKSEQQQSYPGIVYNHPLTYIEYLNYMISARCIVEVMQHGADGFTPRLWEAIMYDKHLVTNNASVFSSEYTHPAIHYWSDCMDWTFLQQKAEYPNEWKLALSPSKVLTQFNQLLVP